jgi:hypothetical protein
MMMSRATLYERRADFNFDNAGLRREHPLFVAAFHASRTAAGQNGFAASKIIKSYQGGYLE